MPYPRSAPIMGDDGDKTCRVWEASLSPKNGNFKMLGVHFGIFDELGVGPSDEGDSYRTLFRPITRQKHAYRPLPPSMVPGRRGPQRGSSPQLPGSARASRTQPPPGTPAWDDHVLVHRRRFEVRNALSANIPRFQMTDRRDDLRFNDVVPAGCNGFTTVT